MQIAILGPLEVRDVDALVEVRGSRLQALLIRLALDAGRVVSVDTLTADLWEDPPADAVNALQSLVSRLRRVLASPSLLESRGRGYLLAIDRDDVDAHRFSDLIRAGRNALQAGDADTALRNVESALGLWRGDPLIEVPHAPFATDLARSLNYEHSAVLLDRLDAEVRLGRGADAVVELKALAAADPLSERLAGLLMQAMYDSGRQAEALDTYESTRKLLADRLGADPSPGLTEIHLKILRGDAAAVEQPHPTNVPATLTSFLGRSDDLHRLTELLSTHRLVTLVGPGGAGKTRLSLAVAANENRVGPVWVAELAPVTDPADIAQAVLDDVDVRDVLLLETRSRRVSRDALTQLVDVLSTAPTLLVLDNCEHLIDAAAQLSDHLLSRCPELRILATSREPLAIAGEALHPLSMLTLPAEGVSPDEALASTAVQLFLDRASAVAPTFALDDSTVAAVVEVCRRLDGLPLAIELAAARLRGMTVDQLAARLDDRFRLLTGGSRTAVARHRTLRAVVEWSWDLLTPDERQVAERFSVFPGGASAAAALAVSLPNASTVHEAEDALAALSDKSLIYVVSDNQGEPRYRMLETLREYGAERLSGRGELLDTRRAHAHYYRDLAEAAEPKLRKPGADRRSSVARRGT